VHLLLHWDIDYIMSYFYMSGGNKSSTPHSSVWKTRPKTKYRIGSFIESHKTCKQTRR